MSDHRRATGGFPIDSGLHGAMDMIFDQSPVALVCTDLQLRVVRVNEAFCGIIGLPAEAIIGRRPTEYSYSFDMTLVERVLAEQVIGQRRPVVDAHLTQRLPDGRERTFTWSAFLLVDGARPIAVCGSLTDISERIETVRTLERAHSRLDLLEQAGNRVGTTLDLYRTASELADLAVPRLADRFTLDLLDRVVSGGIEDARERDVLRLRRVVVRDIRPERRTSYAEGDLITAPVTGSSFIDIMKAGRSSLVVDLARREEDAIYNPGESERLLSAGIHSLLVVPVIARGVTLGIAAFARAETQAPYTEPYRQVANDIVFRAATSIDNARLYLREHTSALTLQQKLLPDKIPSVQGLATAHRYRPVNNAAQVGGDWFDVIPLQAGKVALVVGDVTGHDINAAAVMGQLRITMANLASLGLPEGEIMNRLTQIVGDHGEEAGATCVYAIYDPGSRRCRITSAGHLPPAMLHPDNSVEFIDAHGTMLGLTPGDYELVDVDLPPGSTLVLYTDGLVEKPDQDVTVGMDRLASALAEGPANRPLGELSDAILARLGPYTHDDVALLLGRTDADADDLLETVGRGAQVGGAR